ncbi:hypothetical protein QQF64_015203 [Cirrhinus molitorella]|uniref:Immunoglobulin V-set domain-containing protein n=1 Tax=Cirrhinus molitorella TaxID=172907 RepID=A0ABR3NUA9_9TELE
MFRWTLISLCFIAHYDVSAGQDRVEQYSGEMTASERDDVIRANDFPKYMLRRSKYGAPDNDAQFQERFDSEVSSDSVPLTIKNLRVSDSAVYYCALSYSSAYTNTLHWYRQYPGSAPEFIVLISDGAKDAQESYVDSRFTTKLTKVNKENYVDLEISSASISDSALYYCALEPTHIIMCAGGKTELNSLQVKCLQMKELKLF